MNLKAFSTLLDPLRSLKHGWQLARSNRKLIASADVLFCSFPKSGRTWMRHLLGNLFQQGFQLPHDIDCTDIETLPNHHSGIPKILFLHDDEPFFSTPEELPPNKKAFRRRKLILLVRHPADVVVSSYFQKTKRYVVYGSAQPVFEGTLSEYVYSPRGSTDTYIHYLNLWAREQRRFPHFLMVRYEDLLNDPFREVQRIVAFIGMTSFFSAPVIQAAIEMSSFERMRKMEERGSLGSSTPITNLLDPESFKTRRGKVGGYLDYLQAPEIEHIARKVNGELDKGYGYSM